MPDEKEEEVVKKKPVNIGEQIRKWAFPVFLLIIVIVVLWSKFSDSSSSTDVLSLAPTDSGWARVQIDHYNIVDAFAYKYGKGKEAKYQWILKMPTFDTVRYLDRKTGKDTFALVQKFNKAGFPVDTPKSFTTESKYVLQFWKKTNP